MTAAEPSFLDPSWVAAQRWFRSKARRIASVTEVDSADLPPATLAVIEVGYADAAPPERYLVPHVAGRQPADGDGALAALVDVVDGGRIVQGRAGRFVGEQAAAFEGLRPASRSERSLGVEQSNTSVVIGEALILKLYRLLESGENPDLEVGTFLTNAGFAETPAVAGAIRHEPRDGTPAVAVMLQAFVPSIGDGWSTVLAALADEPPRATALATELGRLTRRLHDALASRPEVPGFPARSARTAEMGAWRASAEDQLARAIASVTGRDHERLVALAPAVRARFADAFGRAAGAERVTRIHGDYHLGQLLARRDGGFSVIDFEGEPARPLVERRGPSSPLRDVAGMLRSLDYAARTARADVGLDADAWLATARDAFLGAYGASGPLLAAFELEKACYEVRYEANNRPDWLSLPLAAIEQLVADA